ncbi:MAG: hypothetical protein AAF063_08555 [Cyanobacteria bacterium J06643_5]
MQYQKKCSRIWSFKPFVVQSNQQTIPYKQLIPENSPAEQSYPYPTRKSQTSSGYK